MTSPITPRIQAACFLTCQSSSPRAMISGGMAFLFPILAREAAAFRRTCQSSSRRLLMRGPRALSSPISPSAQQASARTSGSASSTESSSPLTAGVPILVKARAALYFTSPSGRCLSAWMSGPTAGTPMSARASVTSSRPREAISCSTRWSAFCSPWASCRFFGCRLPATIASPLCQPLRIWMPAAAARTIRGFAFAPLAAGGRPWAHYSIASRNKHAHRRTLSSARQSYGARSHRRRGSASMAFVGSVV